MILFFTRSTQILLFNRNVPIIRLELQNEFHILKNKFVNLEKMTQNHHQYWLAFDMDGTLLTSKKTISHATKSSLLNLHRKGIPIVIATGRSVNRVMLHADDLPPIFYIVSLNGSKILKIQNKIPELLKEAVIPLHVVSVLVSMTRMKNLLAGFYRGNELHICENNKQAKEFFSDLSGMQVVPCNLEKLKQEQISKVIILRDSIDDLPIDQFCNELFGHVKREDCAVFDNQYAIEVNPHGVGKHKGLEYLSKIVNRKQEHLIAFGDDGNDEEMLKFAGMSIIPSNANPRVIPAAKKISNWTNDEDFIAKELSMLLKVYHNTE